MKYLSLFFMVLLSASLAFALPAGDYQVTASPMDLDVDSRIDVNNIEMVVTNEGSFSRWIANNGSSGLFYPRGTTRTAIYAAGLWVGGYQNDAGHDDPLTVTVAEYSYDYTPGQFTSGDCNFYDGIDDPIYKVYKLNMGDDETNNPDYAAWPFDQGAPYVDENLNGQHDPDEPPLILGDQILYSVYTDYDPDRHVNNNGSRFQPMGIEVQHTTFAFNRNDPLGEVVFFKLRVVNRCFEVEDCFFSLWSDPDLGGAGDDYVGCDTLLSLGYCYNSTNNDQQYGSRPPAPGFDFFQGPLVPSDNEEDVARILNPHTQVFEEFPGMRTLPMTSFNKYINGTDPDSHLETYWYMQGLDAKNNGDPIIDPTTGEVSTFFHPGDPAAGTGWLDSNAADRRFMMSTGPFNFPVWEDVDGDGEADLGEPGVQEVVAAIIVGQGGDRTSSVSVLKYNDRFAQEAFDLAFDIPQPPTRPTVTVVEGDGEIVLYWDDCPELSAEEAAELEGCIPAPDSEFDFEGYNVYQYGYIGDTEPRKIATYDLNNGVGIIIQEAVDPNSGALVTVAVQTGTDSGIRRSLRLDED
ncbi:MAG: hypothetical protein GY869_21820, partial [Planctomycetes bacterium]|nr:hypothetical protein [Planctomycetota bacterium]